MRVRTLLPCVLLLFLTHLELAAQPTQQDPLLDALVDRAGRAGFSQTPDLFFLFLSTQPRTARLDGLAVALREQQSPRTDQQRGASASAGGSTTITDKPGISDLLNLAIERGAITQTTSDTTFTLQTTPYMFYTHFGGEDDAAHWDRLTALRHLGLSATFTAGTDTDGGGVSNLQSLEAKYTALGSRSARDRAFREHVRNMLRAEFMKEKEALATTTGLSSKWIATVSEDGRSAFDEAVIAFTNWQESAPKPIPAAAVNAKLAELLGPVQARLTADDAARLETVTASIVEEEATRVALAKAIAPEARTWVAAGPQLSVVYGFNRGGAEPDFSRVKILFEYSSGERLSVNLNAELSINHASGVNRDRIRAYTGEAGLTLGRFANNTLDLTAGARVDHPKGAGETTTALQAKANIYLTSAITVPLALTYANRTETSSRSRLRLNVGLGLNADALLGIARKQ